MDSVGEGEGGEIWENGIEICIISCMKRVTSPGSMHGTGPEHIKGEDRHVPSVGKILQRTPEHSRQMVDEHQTIPPQRGRERQRQKYRPEDNSSPIQNCHWLNYTIFRSLWPTSANPHGHEHVARRRQETRLQKSAALDVSNAARADNDGRDHREPLVDKPGLGQRRRKP